MNIEKAKKVRELLDDKELLESFSKKEHEDNYIGIHGTTIIPRKYNERVFRLVDEILSEVNQELEEL
jgi:hypothetical protein